MCIHYISRLKDCDKHSMLTKTWTCQNSGACLPMRVFTYSNDPCQHCTAGGGEPIIMKVEKEEKSENGGEQRFEREMRDILRGS